MNEQLIRFIELCLEDGVITEKEREIIFRKSRELGVPEDECEILIDSLVSKHSKSSTQSETPKKKGWGVFSSMFNAIKKNIETESIKSSLNQVKEDFQKGIEISKSNEKIEKGTKEENIQPKISSKTTKSENPQKDKTDSKFETKEIRNFNNNGSDEFESILDPSKSFDNPFDIIRHLNVKFKGNQNYYDVHGVRELLKPKIFGTNIWNSTIREQLIEKELTPQGKLQPLGNVSHLGTIIKKELWFGIIDRDEGVLFFPPTNYSTKDGFQSVHNFPKITILNGKKELLSGKPSSYYWNKLIQEIQFEIFKKGKQIDEANSVITYNSDDKYFRVKYTDRPFRLGRSSHTFDSSHEYKLSFNSHLINNILSYIENMFNNGLRVERDKESNQKKIEFERKVKEVDSLKKSLFRRIDKDNNGRIDLFEGENEFNSILRKNQDKLQELGENHIQSFIRMENYLSTKRLNIETLYKVIRSYSVNKKSKLKQGQNFDLKDSIGYLGNQIHLWNLLFFHSVNMLDSIIRDDKITFYEIYEKFDKLGIFNSNWENEVSERLKNIEEGIGNLIMKIQQMESRLILELQGMSYMNSKSIDDLNQSVTQSLQSINSSVNFNNLLTGIQTYQMYKINKNTKSLRE